MTKKRQETKRVLLRRRSYTQKKVKKTITIVKVLKKRKKSYLLYEPFGLILKDYVFFRVTGSYIRVCQPKEPNMRDTSKGEGSQYIR